MCSKLQLGEREEPVRAVHADRRAVLEDHPPEQEEVEVVAVVVRVQVREQHGVEVAQHARAAQLPRDPAAAIDEVGASADDDCLRNALSDRRWQRSSGCSQEDQPRDVASSPAAHGSRRGCSSSMVTPSGSRTYATLVPAFGP